MKRREKRERKKSNYKKLIIIILILVIIACLAYIGYYFYSKTKNKALNDNLAEYIEENIEQTDRANTKSELLLKLEELKKQNSDLIGWLEISDTNINYPVMQTDNNDYYVDHNFNREYSMWGAIFLDKDCDLSKPSNNLLIYGHRSKEGEMFETLTKYKDEEFYKSHKTFNFTTLTEESEYKIIAVFQSQIFYTHQDVFKYYFFKGTENEDEFNNYVENVKKLSMYNIEDTAIYGDELITLSTCDYHVEDGRFVVVAKKIKE